MDYSWLDKDEYPFESRFLKINGNLLHYIDEGSGQILLFVHGTPSWSFEFRRIIKLLRASYRCIAVDHVGFGLSNKPENYDYSTLNHSKVLEQFMITMQLKDVILLLHDFGGPIGFNYALKRPENIRKIIILNSWLFSTKDDPDFRRLSKFLRSPAMPFLYTYLNFSVRFLLPRSFGNHRPNQKILAQYGWPSRERSARLGALAFARSLVHDQDWFDSLWHKRDLLTGINVLLIWGIKDKLVKPNVLEKLKDGFPHAKVLTLPTAGHFPQEEQPQEVATAIRDFIDA